MRKMRRWLRLSVITFLSLLLGLTPAVSVVAAVTEAQIKPFNSATDMEQAGDEADLFLYNVFLTGNHSANSADTEGALAIQGSSFIPKFGEDNGPAGFHYGAMFAGGGVGEDLNARNTIALLIGGQIHSYTNSTLHVGHEQGLLVANENNDDWLTQVNMEASGGVRTMTNAEMSSTFGTLAKKENALTARLNTYTDATLDAGSVTATSMSGPDGKTLTYTARPSQKDKNVYVVDVEPAAGSDTVFMPQIDHLDKLIDDDQMQEIIFTTNASKVVFANAAYYGKDANNQDAMVALQKNSEAARKVSNRTLFYLPNATQVTNYASTSSKTAPDIHDGADGLNADNPVGTDGSDLYDNDYFSQYNKYGTAVMGSVFAPNATIVFTGGNLNGYVFAKNFHQRNGAEAHNFYNPWLESTEIEFTKIWDDDQNRDGKRPKQLTFQLMDGDKVVDEVTVDAAQWDKQQTVKFASLPKYRTDGTLINYTIAEVLPADSEYTAKPEGTTITNTRPIDVTNVSVTKTWQDHDNYLGVRPTSIQVQLYAKDSQGQDAKTAVGSPETITASDNWQHTWKNLPKNINGGHPIEYTIEEVGSSPGYTATSSSDQDGGKIITNTYQPPKFGIQLKKTDADTGRLLKGATYRVGTIVQDNQVVKDGTAQDVTTDDNGIAQFKDLTWQPGKQYYLQEITAPGGYTVDDAVYPITMQPDVASDDGYYLMFDKQRYRLDNGKNGQVQPTVNLTRTDAPMPVLPHTGGHGRTPWLPLGLLITGLGAFVWFIRRRREVM